MKKIILIILAIALIAGGYFGSSYYGFKNELVEKNSRQDWNGASAAIEKLEKSGDYRLLKIIPGIKRELEFEKGLLNSRWDNFKEAVQNFRKSETSPALKAKSIYNAATLTIFAGGESLEKIAEEYIRALKEKPDDFQTKVNLEALKMFQKQQKESMSAKPGQGDKEQKQQKKRVKPFKMKDKEEDGADSPQNSGPRY